MDVRETLEKYNLFDCPLLGHGFTEYHRDYWLDAYLLNFSGVPEGTYRFLFRGCVEFHYETRVPSGSFSMDDILLDLDTAAGQDDVTGYVWGAKHTYAYPGWTLLEHSERITYWKDKYALTLYEFQLEAGIFACTIIFHDVLVTRIAENTDA